MKTKNIFLAAITFSFAIGSAFAALLLPKTVYMRAINAQGQPFCVTCLNAAGGTYTCDDAGNQMCSITVSTTSAGVKTVRGRQVPIATCAVLTNTQAVNHMCFNTGIFNVQ